MIIQYVRQLDTSNPAACPVATGTILEALRASAKRLGLPVTFHPYQQETPMDLQVIGAWLEQSGYKVNTDEGGDLTVDGDLQAVTLGLDVAGAVALSVEVPRPSMGMGYIETESEDMAIGGIEEPTPESLHRALRDELADQRQAVALADGAVVHLFRVFELLPEHTRLLALERIAHGLIEHLAGCAEAREEERVAEPEEQDEPDDDLGASDD
jgi:hypothetical protein